MLPRRSAALVCWLALGIPPAAAAPKDQGAAAGLGLPLASVERPGVAAGLSTVVSRIESESVPGGLLHLRGEVQGSWAPDAEVGAVTPLLSADLGAELGRLQLFLTGGVQIFGVAWRDGYTFFTTFGLVGGGGLSVRVHERLQIEARCTVTWLPSFAAARLEEPDPAPDELPTLLFLGGLLGVVVGW